jgi:DNA-binding transcriptional LysR family regulator
MELRQLQIFYTAAQSLNFTKAAQKLGYVQSNITNQVQQLEEELHVKLFERFGRGLQLTSEGKLFLKHVEYILQLVGQAKREFLSDEYSGVLIIEATETLCIYRLPALLMEYRKHYPLVEVRVHADSPDFLELVRNNSIDVALALTNGVKEPDMSVMTLCKEKMIMVVSPEHPLTQLTVVRPEDLSGQCFILSEVGCIYRPTILEVFKKHEVKPSAIMELSSIGARKECTRCGLGVTLLPQIAAKDELQRGELVQLPWQGPSLDVQTQLIHHREKWLSPALKSFLALCAASYCLE